MSKFQMSNYLPEEDIQSDLPTDDPVEKATKEVKVAKLGEKSASEVIAKALIEVLRREDIELMRRPDDTGNGIFSRVKIISTEEINNDLKGVLSDLNEDDIIVTDMFIPKTRGEEMFDASIADTNIQVYNNIDRAAKVLTSLSQQETLPTTENPSSHVLPEGVSLTSLFPGDKTVIDDCSYEVVFRDSFVMLLRKEDQHPSTKDDYLLIDCPKGV